jgi:hypothetical protein
MFQSERLQEKWAPLLNYEGLDPIKDSHRKAVTAVLLENQEKFLREQSAFERGGMLMEQPTMNTGSGANAGFSADATATGPVAGFDPVLISLIRRSMPNLVAYDLAGVQPMNGPTGLIFAMRTNRTTGDEAFYNEADTAFSGQPFGRDDENGFVSGDAGMGTTSQNGTNPAVLNPVGSATSTDYNVGGGMRTDSAEALDTGANAFNQMNFSIEKVTVTAKSRALKAEYSLELAQDLKTAKSSEPSIRLLSKVLFKTPLPLVYSTSTLTPTVVGLLRSSRVSCSKSSATLTRLHKELVAERATSSCALLTLLQH